MPIYEYACEQCGDRFEVKQSIKDAPLVTCSRCGGTVKKLISSPAIMFKGSGWYVTDYSDKLKPPAGENASPSADGKKDTASEAPATPAASTATSTPATAGPSANSTTAASTASPTPSSTPAASK